MSRPSRLLLVLLGCLAVLTALATPVTAAPDAVPSGEGAWPLRPRPDVVGGFDPPAESWGSGHRGVDLRGRPGAVVRSTLPGTVVYAARLAGRGVVSVDHGGFRTTYEPVTATVHRGDRVGRGETLGRLEWAGSHCFPAACLHWGLRLGETYRDPLVLVGEIPVRLLPFGGLAGPTGLSGPSGLSGPAGLSGARAWPSAAAPRTSPAHGAAAWFALAA